jgi:hypothetical protein
MTIEISKCDKCNKETATPHLKNSIELRREFGQGRVWEEVCDDCADKVMFLCDGEGKDN